MQDANRTQDNNRLCQFVIPMAYFEVPNVLAAAMFGMVVLRCNPLSDRPGGPPNVAHYYAWHPKFPSTAFHVLNASGKPPEAPWVLLHFGEIDAQTNMMTIAWSKRGAPKDQYLWSSTITLDRETVMAMPGFNGEVAGHG